MQNGFIERFNGSYRREILDAYVFFELDEVWELTEQWMEQNNSQRPHQVLNNIRPNEWKEQTKTMDLSNLELSE